MKLDTLTNSVMQNSMAVFNFFFFNQKHFFWASLVQNVKIMSLRLNLVASIGILKSHTHQKEYHQPSVDDICQGLILAIKEENLFFHCVKATSFDLCHLL